MVKPRFKLEMDFNLNNIKLDLHKELNLIGGIIAKDHKDRLESSTDVNGKPLKKLRPNTIASKRAKGYAKPTKPLIATGTLQKLPPFKKATSRKQSVEIEVAKSRKVIGNLHQQGTKPYIIKPKNKSKLAFTTTTGTAFAKMVKHSGLPKREFWGITNKVSAKAMKFIELEIERILKNV
tara:strand:- start:6071 stop:6607 length:537 start_codon:yes stop_codon:yes gene_type:complete